MAFNRGSVGWSRLILAVAACATVPGPSTASAQDAGAFEARLVDRAKQAPIAGAIVSVVGTAGSVRTDGDGRFSWEPVPAIPFQIIIVLPGGQVAKPILIERIEPLPALLAVDALADESLTVLGAAPSIHSAPASGMTVLSGSVIAERSPEHLMQALEGVPGVGQVSEGHAAVPAVRGLARGRTLFLIDGARVSSERRVGPSATFLDPSVVEGIDIARGPGSVAYGSDALGGVISVRTRRAEPGSPLHARVSGTFGGGVPDRRGSFEMSKGLAHGGVLVQAHVRRAEDYDSPEGSVLNSGWEDQGLLVHGTHALGRGLVAAAWQSDYGRDVERPRNNSNTVRFYYPFENSHRFTASYEIPDVAGFRQVAVTGFLGSYEQRTDQDRFATPTTGRSIERADVSANDFHVKASGDRLVRHARLEVGVDANGRYDLEALDIIQAYSTSGTITRDTTNVSVDDARRLDLGAYAQVESKTWKMTRLAGGLRVDQVTTTNIGGYFGDHSTSNAAASGFGALTVGPFSGLSITTQVSRGFRDPTLSDRYFRGPSGRGFITGNPDLEPETSLQLDLAVRYARDRAQFAAYVYQYRIDDLIERYQTEPDFFFFRNRGRARLRGVELEARSDLGRGYALEFGTTIASGIALDDGARLDDVPPVTVSLLGRKAFGDRFYAHARLAVASDDDRPGPSEVAVPGATIVDLGGGWRIGPTLELRGLLRNLLDEIYYSSPDPRRVFAPGRSASLTAVVQF